MRETEDELASVDALLTLAYATPSRRAELDLYLDARPTRWCVVEEDGRLVAVAGCLGYGTFAVARARRHAPGGAWPGAREAGLAASRRVGAGRGLRDGRPRRVARRATGLRAARVHADRRDRRALAARGHSDSGRRAGAARGARRSRRDRRVRRAVLRRRSRDAPSGAGRACRRGVARDTLAARGDQRLPRDAGAARRARCGGGRDQRAPPRARRARPPDRATGARPARQRVPRHAVRRSASWSGDSSRTCASASSRSRRGVPTWSRSSATRRGELVDSPGACGHHEWENACG